MSKAATGSADKESIAKCVLETRHNGGTWNDAWAAAKRLGFAGSLTTLQRMLKPAQPAPVSKKSKVKADASQHKNRTAPATSKSAASEFNVSSPAAKTTARKNPAKSKPVPKQITLAAIEKQFPLLTEGTLYTRPIALFHGPFHEYGIGELAAASRISNLQEALSVTNTHTTDRRGAEVLVDGTLNHPGTSMTVVFNSAQTESQTESSPHAVGTRLEVHRRWDGAAFVALLNLAPGEKIVLLNDASLSPVAASQHAISI